MFISAILSRTVFFLLVFPTVSSSSKIFFSVNGESSNLEIHFLRILQILQTFVIVGISSLSCTPLNIAQLLDPIADDTVELEFLDNILDQDLN